MDGFQKSPPTAPIEFKDRSGSGVVPKRNKMPTGIEMADECGVDGTAGSRMGECGCKIVLDELSGSFVRFGIPEEDVVERQHESRS